MVDVEQYVADWLSSDPWLDARFATEISQQVNSVFIVTKDSGRNVCYITDEFGSITVNIMDPNRPLPSLHEQTSANWVEFDLADPKVFEVLREYLTKSVGHIV